MYLDLLHGWGSGPGLDPVAVGGEPPGWPQPSAAPSPAGPPAASAPAWLFALPAPEAEQAAAVSRSPAQLPVKQKNGSNLMKI